MNSRAPLFAGVNEHKQEPVPVVLVRGFISSDNFLQHLEKAIKAGGITEVRYPEFTSRFGGDGIDKMGEQIAEAVTKLKKETGSEKVDIIAYSMGALAARYYLQRLDGVEHVRKFISISGANHGTYTSYFGYFQKGLRDMAPKSALIEDLNKDINPFGSVQVYCYYTPYDMIIIPASSGILKEAHEVKQFQVVLHQRMVKDEKVLREVVSDLTEPYPQRSLATQASDAALPTG